MNLAEREIEVYRQPSAAGYAELQRMREGTVSPAAFPGEAIGLEEILGPAVPQVHHEPARDREQLGDRRQAPGQLGLPPAQHLGLDSHDLAAAAQ